MRTATLVLITALLIGGCATSEQLAVADDAECKSWGATPKTDEYMRCRALLSHRRTEQAKAAGMYMANAMKAQSDAYYRAAQQPVYVPKTTRCFHNGQYVTCSTW